VLGVESCTVVFLEGDFLFNFFRHFCCMMHHLTAKGDEADVHSKQTSVNK